MKEMNLILLLHIINNKGNIKRLTREGLTYKNITELIEVAVDKELLIYEKEKISLTKEGLTYLLEGQEILKKQNKNEWIEKDLKNKIPKLDKNLVFLPRQNELTF